MERIKVWLNEEENTVRLGLLSATILYVFKMWIYCYANHSVAIGLAMSIWNCTSLLGLILYFILTLYSIQEERKSKVAKWILLITTLLDFGITIAQMAKIWTTPNFYPGYLVEQIIHFLVLGVSIWYFIYTIFQQKKGHGNIIFCFAILVEVMYASILEYLAVKDVNLVTVMFGLLTLLRLPYFYLIRKKEIDRESARKSCRLLFSGFFKKLAKICLDTTKKR